MSKPFLRVVPPPVALSADAPASTTFDDPNLPLSDRILILAERELAGLDYGFSIDADDEEEDDEQFERAAARQHQITDLMRNSVARSLAGLNAKGQVLKRLISRPDGVEQIMCSIVDDIARLLEEEKRGAT